MDLQTFINRPENALYLWATTDFTKYLDKKTRSIVTAKHDNVVKLINTLAIDAGTDLSGASNLIKTAFVNAYGMTPAQALVKLAKGEEVCGKNWAAGVYGVYGVGAVVTDGTTVSYLNNKRSDFNQNQNVTVDKSTGKIYVNGTLAANQKTVYTGSKIKSYTYTDESGNTYSSIRLASGKYYAYSYTASGSQSTQDANGNSINSIDAADLWTSCNDTFSNFWNWLMNLLGINKEETVLDPQNTIPQQTDGFVQEEGLDISTAAMWGAVALGAGALLASGKIAPLNPKKSKKSK